MGSSGSISSGPAGAPWQPPTPEALQVSFPQYEIAALLGRGGMGAVYKGWQKSLDRFVAIKILPPLIESDPDGDFSQRFKREARSMARLTHPGIVAVFDAGETADGLHYFVMEFVEGTDVAQMLRAMGRLPQEYALSISAHVCDALQYAHSHGIVHRDIKPANIMVDVEGRVKVADFGLAKHNDGSASGGLTRSNVAMGTPDFIAPEVMLGESHVDGRADLYAVGVMLYQMLTGEVPRGMFMMPSMRGDRSTDPRFDAIIARAMQTDRESRYQSAADLRRDLDVILTMPVVRAGDTHGTAAVPKQIVTSKPPPAAPPQERPAPNRGRPPPVPPRPRPVEPPEPPETKSSSMGLAVAAFVLIGIAAWSFLGGGRPSEPESPKQQTTEAPVLPKQEPAPPAPVATVAVPEEPVPPPAPAMTPAVVEMTTPPPPSRPRVSEVQRFRDSRFQLVREVKTWTEAKAAAETAGGHLAIIPDQETEDWVRETFLEELDPDTGFWLGAQKESYSGQWTWINGDKLAFDNRPSNAPGGHIPHNGLIWRRVSGEPEAAPATWWVAGVKSKDVSGYLVQWRDLPPADPVADRLVEIERGFLAAYDRQAGGPHQTEVADLNAKYLAALDRALAIASQAGSLDEALLLRTEKSRVENTGTVPEESDPDTPKSLADLRATYHSALQTLLAKREKLAEPLYATYDRALAGFQDELTRAQKLDEASRVRAVREAVAGQREAGRAPDKAAPPPAPGPKPAAAPQSGLLPPAVTPLSADKILPIPPKATAEELRAVVEWGLGNGGLAHVLEKEGEKRVDTLAALPKGRLTLTRFGVREIKMDAEGLQWLSILGRAPDLVELSFGNLGLLPVEHLRGATKLKILRLSPEEVDEAAFAHLSGLRQLEEFWLSYRVKKFTGIGLGFFSDSLLRLQLDSPDLSEEGAAHLLRFKKLQVLNFCDGSASGRCNVNDAMLKVVAGLPELTTLSLTDTKITGAFLASLPANSKLKQLLLNRVNTFETGHFKHLTKLKHLEILRLPSPDPDPEALASIAAMGNLGVLSLEGNDTFTWEQVKGINGFAALRELGLGACPVGDAGLEAIVSAMPNLRFIDMVNNENLTPAGLSRSLSRLASLQTLNFHGDRTTDEWTPHLAQLKGLTYLMLTYSRVTDEGVAPLMKLPLWYLRLTGAPVTDGVVPVLKTSKTLTEVNLDGTQLSESAKADLLSFLRTPPASRSK